MDNFLAIVIQKQEVPQKIKAGMGQTRLWDEQAKVQKTKRQNKHKTLEEKNAARAQKHYRGSPWSTRNWQRQWGTHRLKCTRNVKLIRAGPTVIVENNKLIVRLAVCNHRLRCVVEYTFFLSFRRLTGLYWLRNNMGNSLVGHVCAQQPAQHRTQSLCTGRGTLINNKYT